MIETRRRSYLTTSYLSVLLTYFSQLSPLKTYFLLISVVCISIIKDYLAHIWVVKYFSVNQLNFTARLTVQLLCYVTFPIRISHLLTVLVNGVLSSGLVRFMACNRRHVSLCSMSPLLIEMKRRQFSHLDVHPVVS